jgi:cation diffusion facilitator CzcD-associated flavoprotein CzcO
MTREHFDVLIVGAGLSGIGAACHLLRACPGKRFAILEARDAIGGTWDLFRYPGVRSDSDMFTLGYAFRPWRAAKAIADGDAIRGYIRDTARDHGLDARIRFGHRVVAAAWSTPEARWTVEVARGDSGERQQLTCGFLFMCSGYYRYDQGYAPALPGSAQFAGTIVHPQHWPADLDYTGKRVVVIGSGATAVTLVPAMAARAAHVTMLQRSPTYIVSMPSRDRIADGVRRLLPARVAYPMVRWKNVLLGTLSYQLSRRRPRWMKALMRRGVARALPPDYDLATHFTPRYEPWDQRVCLVPDGDLFQAIRSGKASIVTDQIQTFTPTGLALASGAALPADIVVTATGLNLLVFGGLAMTVDGRAIDYARTVSYKGMMLSGVPSFAYALGYTNASWTLKVDLVAGYVCRLLNHMDRQGATSCTPRPPDPEMATEPFLDLRSGYVERAVAQLPRQGARAPWRLYQNYVRDVLLFKLGAIEDGTLELGRAAAPAPVRAPVGAPAGTRG